MSMPMRRKDRLLDEVEAWEILRNGEYGTIGTICDDGSPYNTPISYVVIGRDIFFHCARNGRKLDNMKREPHVCFSVVGKTQPVYADENYSTFYESAVAFGTAFRVEEDGEKIRMLEALCRKYLPDAMEHFDTAAKRSLAVTDIWKIEVAEISGKAKR